MGVIFYLSSQPDLKSGFESQTDFILRKLAHITEYGILIFLAWRALSDGGEEKKKRYLIVAFIFSVLYAASDEYHQLFVHGRVGSSVDVMIDSMGILISAVLIKIKFIRGK
jgi:VanZ family protein